MWKDLRACGHALLRVLLIDNGSGDGSAQRLRLAVGDDAEVMAFDHNLGYCAAMNRSLDWAEGQGIEHVLFLNNDVRLPPGFLTPMVEALDHDPGLAGVGPTVLDPDGKVWCQGGAVRFGPNLSHLRGQGREPAPKTHGPELVDYLPGACDRADPTPRSRSGRDLERGAIRVRGVAYLSLRRIRSSVRLRRLFPTR